MKKIILMLVAAAFAATTIFTAAIAADAPEKFTIDYLKDTKTAVEFPHLKHSKENKIECKTCHHTSKEGATPKACKECHKKGATTKTDVGDAPDPCHDDKCKKNIFHDRCKGCHKEKDKGPTKCKECHPKSDDNLKSLGNYPVYQPN